MFDKQLVYFRKHFRKVKVDYSKMVLTNQVLAQIAHLIKIFDRPYRELHLSICFRFFILMISNVE